MLRRDCSRSAEPLSNRVCTAVSPLPHIIVSLYHRFGWSDCLFEDSTMSHSGGRCRRSWRHRCHDCLYDICHRTECSRFRYIVPKPSQELLQINRSSTCMRTFLLASLRVSRKRALPLRSLVRIIWHPSSSCNTVHYQRKALPTTLARRVRLNLFQAHRYLPKHPPVQAILKCVVDAEETMKIAGIVHVGSASSAADAVEDGARMASAIWSGSP